MSMKLNLYDMAYAFHLPGWADFTKPKAYISKLKIHTLVPVCWCSTVNLLVPKHISGRVGGFSSSSSTLKSFLPLIHPLTASNIHPFREYVVTSTRGHGRCCSDCSETFVVCMLVIALFTECCSRRSDQPSINLQLSELGGEQIPCNRDHKARQRSLLECARLQAPRRTATISKQFAISPVQISFLLGCYCISFQAYACGGVSNAA